MYLFNQQNPDEKILENLQNIQTIDNDLFKSIILSILSEPNTSPRVLLRTFNPKQNDKLDNAYLAVHFLLMNAIKVKFDKQKLSEEFQMLINDKNKTSIMLDILNANQQKIDKQKNEPIIFNLKLINLKFLISFSLIKSSLLREQQEGPTEHRFDKIVKEISNEKNAVLPEVYNANWNNSSTVDFQGDNSKWLEVTKSITAEEKCTPEVRLSFQVKGKRGSEKNINLQLTYQELKQMIGILTEVNDRFAEVTEV